jgi:hypothetical protein
MKSFLDRFRRKSATDASDKKPETGRDIALEAARAAPATERPAKAPAPPKEEFITLYLDDFLNRIPPEMLAADPPDPRAPIPFGIDDLAQHIVEGRTTISLSELQRRAPALFHGEIQECDDFPLRFPWLKLLDMVKRASTSNPLPGISPAAAEALAQTVRHQKRKPGARTVNRPMPGAAGPTLHTGAQPAWYSRPAPLRPASTPGDAQDAAPPKPEPGARQELSPSEEEAIAGAINRICDAADAEVSRAIEEHRQTLADLERERDEARAHAARLEEALATMSQERDALAAEKAALESKLAGLFPPSQA